MRKTEPGMSGFLDRVSDFLAERKGLLPLIGICLVIINLVLEFIIPGSFLTNTDLLLHLGIVLAIFGIMIGRAL